MAKRKSTASNPADDVTRVAAGDADMLDPQGRASSALLRARALLYGLRKAADVRADEETLEDGEPFALYVEEIAHTVTDVLLDVQRDVENLRNPS